MRKLILSLAVLVGVMLVRAEPVVAQGGGCYQLCSSNGYCDSGGGNSDWCVQGYQGPQPVCWEFSLFCNEPGALTILPSACKRSLDAQADRAVGRFYRCDVFKSIYHEAENETVRMGKLFEHRSAGVTVGG